jgi:hypothetical protein
MEAANRDWILVTRDAKMWRKRAQRDELLRAGIGVFVVVSTVAHTPAQLLALLSRRVPEMWERALRAKRPFVLRVPDRGSIEPFA